MPVVINAELVDGALQYFTSTYPQAIYRVVITQDKLEIEGESTVFEGTTMIETDIEVIFNASGALLEETTHTRKTYNA